MVKKSAMTFSSPALAAVDSSRSCRAGAEVIDRQRPPVRTSRGSGCCSSRPLRVLGARWWHRALMSGTAHQQRTANRRRAEGLSWAGRGHLHRAAASTAAHRGCDPRSTASSTATTYHLLPGDACTINAGRAPTKQVQRTPAPVLSNGSASADPHFHVEATSSFKVARYRRHCLSTVPAPEHPLAPILHARAHRYAPCAEPNRTDRRIDPDAGYGARVVPPAPDSRPTETGEG